MEKSANIVFINGYKKILDNLLSPTYSFSVNLGVYSDAPTQTGMMYIYREGISSNNGFVSIDNENMNGRMIPTYDRVTTTLSSSITNVTSENISLTNISDLGIVIGDYLIIDDEIVRVKTTTSGTNPIRVFRGVLGSE